MIRRGLIDEVIELVREGFHKDCTAGRAIGYSQTLNFLDSCIQCINEMPSSECLIKLDSIFIEYMKNFQAASRSYSRKQDHWFNGDPLFNWIHWNSFKNDEELLLQFLVQNIQQERLDWENSALTDIRKEIDVKARLWRFEAGKVEKEMRTYVPILKIYNSLEVRQAFVQKLYNDILQKLK